MIGLVAAAWGLFGGFAVSGLDLYALLRRRGCWPWQDRKGQPAPDTDLPSYFTGEVIRMVVGAGLAWAAAGTGQVSGPLGAVGIGAAAPFILDHLSRSAAGGSPARYALSRGHGTSAVEVSASSVIAGREANPRPGAQGQG
jgi:hypothetical protein